MNKTVKIALQFSAATLIAFTSQVFASDTIKSNAVDLLQRGLAQGDIEFINENVAKDYIQHNPVAQDGREGLIQFSHYLSEQKTPIKINTARVLREGNLVVVHSEYITGGKKAVFDLFRVDNGQFVEHWDAIQDVPEKSVSGRSMIDGPTKIIDREKTQENKKIVTNFVTDILLKGQSEKITRYIGTSYHQHNPNISDNLEGLGAFIKHLGDNSISFGYKKIHNIVAEGNFVFTQSEGDFGGQVTAFYDLFRVENGMIVEHWDTVQAIPNQLAHNNTMF